MLGNIYIIGTHSTPFRSWPEKSFKDLSRDAYLEPCSKLLKREIRKAFWIGAQRIVG